jgi:beta-lactamase class A
MLGYFRKIWLIVLFFAIGFGAGIGVFRIFFCHQEKFETHQVRRQGEYKFINPLYECEIGDENYLKKYVPFEDKIKNRIKNEVGQNNIQLAYYFRNLNNGPWFGVNENINYAPASLLKVPIMMAYYKLAENNPGILNQRLTFIRSQENNPLPVPQIQPSSPLADGASYTIEELIEKMIIYSDNDSMVLLSNNLSQAQLAQAYNDLGIINPYGENKDDVITVKDYASFFRILYNAAYLNQDYSEKSLSLLAQSAFKGGLAAGVPDNVVVADKFGERELIEGNYKEQFHDCGIVYYPKYPYLLCVMSRGDDRDTLVRTVKDVSHIIYEEISRSYP